MTINVGILGANGRMGRQLIKAAIEYPNIEMIGGTVREGSPLAGIDLGELAGVGALQLTANTQLSSLKAADVLIDFTSVEATLSHVQWCVENQKAIVIGTTGFNESQLITIKQASETIPVLLAPNTSVGVNLLLKLVEIAAKAIGNNTDIEIIEAHHRFKKDAPSGTAMKIGEVIAQALDRNLADCAVYGREGIMAPRDDKTIGFATIRAGDIIGEHTALFADLGERIEITHKASSRMTFAMGAMRAASWLVEQPNGFYSMQDVLSLG
jgi:4-hydroxy-tetrahydrodipicolinate reductase